MSSSLERIPRLLRRLVLLGFSSLALLAMAGLAGTTEPTEGEGEVSVHAAAQFANIWTKHLFGEADEDDHPDAALLARAPDALTWTPPYAATTRPPKSHVPVAPDRSQPAARAPPILG